MLLIFTIRDSPQFRQTQAQIDMRKITKGLLGVIKNRYIWLNGLIGFCLYAPTIAVAEL